MSSAIRHVVSASGGILEAGKSLSPTSSSAIASQGDISESLVERVRQTNNPSVTFSNHPVIEKAGVAVKTSSVAATSGATNSTVLGRVSKTGFSGDPRNQAVAKMSRCKFFFSARGCAQGNGCKFSHDLATTIDNGSNTTASRGGLKTEQAGTQKGVGQPRCKFYASGFCKWGNSCGFLHSERSQKPQSPSSKPNQHLDKKLSEMSEQDLKALRKTEITQLKKRYPKRVDVDSNTFQFVFRISDPDWPFDVKAINIQLVFPDLYPKHIMAASIFDEDALPSTLARHICMKMNDWLTDKLEACQRMDKVELVFRPFLRWLDKIAEQIFTDGLSMYKRELTAKAAGFTFVHYSDSRPSTSAAAVDDVVKASDQITNDIQVATSELDEEFSSAVILEAGPVEPDVPVTADSTSSSNAVSAPQVSIKLSPAKRGTELRLKNLQLLESAATLHCTILRTGIRCTRCKTVHHISMHPEKPYVVVCDKCRSKMSLIYHANLMHAASCTVGFFDLDACQPFDLILQDCQLVAGCLNCDKELLVHGLHAEQEKQFWCISCHKKMIISVEKGSYIVLNAGAAIKIGADAVLIAKKAKAKSDLKILAEGRQLPDKGACLHYKKSFRWFRFPCCGKLYPCDKCHDEKETDHEMELANRMICGFCSKEQGFSLTKPCVSCDASLTRAKSQHWEGGQGCRSKIAMAKGDKQKFAGSNKTVSKKGETVKKKSGQKTTHVRHAD